MIDWDLMRENWNKDYKTEFQDIKEFLGSLYKKYKSCPKIADILIVSPYSVNRALRKNGIKLLDKGHRFPSPKQKTILDMDCVGMAINEIVEITGLTSQYVWMLLRRFKKEYKRRRKPK